MPMKGQFWGPHMKQGKKVCKTTAVHPLITLEDGPENPQKYKYDFKAKHLVQFRINIRKVCKIIPGYDDEE